MHEIGRGILDAIKEPSQATLRKYGLSLAEWWAIVARQHGVCAVCGKTSSTGRFNIDHDHVQGWRKMKPELRKLHVRGLVCWFDNKYLLGRGITAARSRAVTAYLEAHVERLVREGGKHAF